MIEGLSAVERAIGDNINLPVLRNFLIEAKSKISLTSTNLELAIKHTVAGKIIEEGEITVPFSAFNAIVSNLNSERITLEQKDRDLIINADNYEGVIRGQASKEFPIIPLPQNKKQSIKISAAALKRAISQVIIATHYSDIRPEISGVFLNLREGKIYFVVTDSFRLAEKTIEAKEFQTSFETISAIIPIKTAQELLRIFPNPDDEIEIFIDSNQIVFQTGNQLIISRLIDGVFPDYLSIIPKQIQSEISVNCEELMNAVKLASVFSGRASDISLTIGENKKFLEVFSSDSAAGENRCRVPIKTKNAGFSIVFNWRYLLDGLRIHKGKEIVLGVNVSDKPAVIRGEDDSSLVYIVMPIRS